MTISENRVGGEISFKYPGICVKEEKVFHNFSAYVIYKHDGSKGLAEFQLDYWKVTNPINSILKWFWFCLNYCTVEDIKSIKYIILNR